MNANKFVKKYTMVLALLVVFVFFTYLTGGRLLLAPVSYTHLTLPTKA